MDWWESDGLGGIRWTGGNPMESDSTVVQRGLDSWFLF